jgi:hypothetical protein
MPEPAQNSLSVKTNVINYKHLKIICWHDEKKVREMSHRRYHSDWELEQREDPDPVESTAFAGAEVFTAGSGALPFSYKNIS